MIDPAPFFVELAKYWAKAIRSRELKKRKVGEAICFQHKGYKPYEYYFTPNVYDHYTTKIIAIWRKKIKP